jgi:hypothetical protein
MTKFLLYIVDQDKYDLNAAVELIKSIDEISNSRQGEFIGAVFECIYKMNAEEAVVRISKLEDVITIDGSREIALDFSLKFQDKYPKILALTNEHLTFNISLAKGLSLGITVPVY